MFKKESGFSLLIFLITLLWQNCSASPLHFQGAVTEQSLSAGVPAPYLQWTLKSASGLSVSRLSQVQKWLDSTGQGISLYPPLMSGTDVINLSAAPTMASTDTGSLITFGPETSLLNEVGDLSSFLGQEYSFAGFIHNVQTPTSGNMTLRLFEFYPADGSESGDLVLDVVDLGNGKVQFNAYEWYDGSNYAISSLQMPKTDLSGGIGFAVGFTNDPKKLNLFVNGQAANLIVTGNPSLLGNVTRELNIHGINYGQEGQFDLAEFDIWTNALNTGDLNYYSQMLLQTFTTGTVTVVPPGSGGPSGGSGQSNFAGIQPLLSVCTSCHSEVSSQTAIVAAVGTDGVTHWITPGNGAGSLMIQALQHQSGVLAMPKDGNQLSQDEINQISQWIDAGAL